MIRDDEEHQNLYSDAKLVKDILNMDIEAFKRYRLDASNGLRNSLPNYFLFALGVTLSYASTKDAVRILFNWQRECSQAAMEWRIYEAKERAEFKLN